ncbi:MAG: flippase [Oribacterium sp.]|nr:flippase [Oribacterium sp.]
MKKQSIKTNAVLNLIKTLMSVLFPLITFPYASRVLLPEGIGKVQFASSIISYFSLLATLGITSYGVREGAKYRDSKEKLSIFAKEIFTINALSTLISYAILFVLIFIVPKFYEYRNLLIVSSSSILFTALGMEWLYTALEDFKYITIRSISFQFLSLILLFAFVHTKDDVLEYAAISVVSSVGSNAFNFINSRKYINFKGIRVKLLDLKKHIGPVLILFIMVVTSSIYTILDTSMLGFLTNDYQVGLYTAATKINRIVLNLVVSIGAVLLPRLSYYKGTNDNEKFLKLAYKSADLILALSIPAAIGLSVLSDCVIEVISGVEYMGAVPVMRIINPIIIIVGMSNFLGVQLFMPLRKERWTLYSDLAGAFCNLSLNMMLIPSCGALGAAIASLVAELVVTGVQMYLARKYVSISSIMLGIIKYLIMGAIMGAVVLLSSSVQMAAIMKLVFGIVSGLIIYCVELLITKNQWAILGISILKGKINACKKGI